MDSPWNFPPTFYDKLSKVWLTPLALQELDRQSAPQHQLKLGVSKTSHASARRGGSSTLDSTRFASACGPDICDIRGLPRTDQSMQYHEPTRRETTKPTRVSAQKRSIAYDANFRQHCEDHHMYPPFYRFPDSRRPPKPANLNEIRQALKVPSGSLSPSTASESAFEDFQCTSMTGSESTLMAKVIPFITGDTDIPNEGHLPFTNLDERTKNITLRPNPDFFDGARPEAIDQGVREALYRTVVPTVKTDAPIAPNLFLEVESTTGTLDVAKAQVILDGAHGVMMMHALQNHLLEKPVYDDNAYSFTAIFHGGCLYIYAHYLTAPAELGQNPRCHMAQLHIYALTASHEAWLDGVGAFRNLRKLAKKYRDQFIETANARVRRRRAEATAIEGGTRATEEKSNEVSGPAIVSGCPSLPESSDSNPETEETNNELDGPHLDRHGQGEAGDRAHSRLATEASTGVETNLASSLASEAREKDRNSPHPQPHAPRSPPSPLSPRLAKKKRGGDDG
ncbi:uncharacterized protein F5Z01DRAFT_634414 [Emericellopsis atlantica]|uniref:DUF7924 domain-containing protein n=1 Tax=Emericellopsis atlantica TaxID=2614577 RepID=A0A9P7ZSH6_9HYPO|nr:uncharacterized protein F5Z01DRAFT_634414 [Emericellopsis atlantica]KAG9256848.1 hypothetical protein F5Z01DRAFT_634414 [Emericellopsis atlantica]